MALCFIAVLAATSCALIPSGPATDSRYVEFSPPSESAWTWRKRQSNPLLYELRSAEAPSLTLFATTLEECPMSPGVPLEAVTRRLFVGFEDLKVVSQETRTIGNREVLLTLLDATGAELPLRLASYSLRNGECLIDFVLWAPRSEFDKNPAGFAGGMTAMEGAIAGFRSAG